MKPQKNLLFAVQKAMKPQAEKPADTAAALKSFEAKGAIARDIRGLWFVQPGTDERDLPVQVKGVLVKDALARRREHEQSPMDKI